MTERIVAFNSRSVIILRVERMRWNLTTQKRHLKHDDAPPEDCEGWDFSYRYAYCYLHRNGWGTTVDDVLKSLMLALEQEPNRWFRVTIHGSVGYPDPTAFRGFNHVKSGTWTVLGPFCKDKGVMPDLMQNENGEYELPFNLPDGVALEYDESKPDWDGTGDPVAKQPRLDTTPIAVGEEIVILDDWGLPVTTTEVV